MKRTSTPSFAMSGETWRCDACTMHVGLPCDYTTAFRIIDAHRCTPPKPNQPAPAPFATALIWLYVGFGCMAWLAAGVVLIAWVLGA